eukprot:1133519-Pelagomonas_calceolata.AAC.9
MAAMATTEQHSCSNQVHSTRSTWTTAMAARRSCASLRAPSPRAWACSTTTLVRAAQNARRCTHARQ